MSNDNNIPFTAEAYPISFIQTRRFQKDVSRVFSDEEFIGFINYIAANPASGDIISGAHGLRKIRWKAKGFGKRGGARVIYYFRDLNMPLLLLAVYTKNERSTLTKNEIHGIEMRMKEIISRLAVNSEEVFRRQSARSA